MQVCFFSILKCKVLMRIGFKFGVSVLQSLCMEKARYKFLIIILIIICNWKYLETCLLPRGGLFLQTLT